MPGDLWTSVASAAKTLAISEQAVRKLLVGGDLVGRKQGRDWLVDRQSIRDRRRLAPSSGRPLSPAMAWAVLLLASGQSPPARLGSGHVPSRARRWNDSHDVAKEAGKLRTRAVSERFAMHRSEAPRILERPDVMRTGLSAAAQVGLIGGGDRFAEIYAPASHRFALIREHGLISGEGNLLIRWLAEELWGAIQSPVAPRAAVLIDLLESDDPRAQREAAAALSTC